MGRQEGSRRESIMIRRVKKQRRRVDVRHKFEDDDTARPRGTGASDGPEAGKKTPAITAVGSNTLTNPDSFGAHLS
jgi:hypothetical protein